MPVSLQPLPVVATRRTKMEPALALQCEALDLVVGLLRPCLGAVRARRVAMRLIEEFGSVTAVLAAPIHRLMEIRGLGEASARHLADIFHAARYVAAERVDLEKPLLTKPSALLDYCRLQMAFLPVEQFRILFLDRKNRLIADEVQRTGTVDNVPAYPREVMRRALELSATVLILVHNHPSGDPTPSTADLRITKEIDDAAKLLDIVLLEHFIIGRSGHVGIVDMVRKGPSAAAQDAMVLAQLVPIDQAK